MLQLLRDVITQPSVAFRELPERAGPRLAAAIILVLGVLTGLAALRVPAPVGVKLALILTTIGGYFLVWAAAAAVSGFVARKFVKGAGSMGASFTLMGFAAVPLVIQVALGTVLETFQLGTGVLQMLPLLCLGWTILLVYIGSREIHDLGGGGAALCAAVAVFMVVIVNIPLGRVTNYLFCFVQVPAPETVEWTELPKGLKQIVVNPGFEEAPKAAPEGGEGAKPEEPSGPGQAKEFLPGWRMAAESPMAFLCTPSYTLDTQVRRTGRVAVRLALTGVPQADMASSIYQSPAGLTPGEVAYLSVTMKSESAVFGMARVYFAAGEGARVRGIKADHPLAVIVQGTTPWKTYRVKTKVPAETSQAILELSLRGRGVLWVDRVDLYVPSKTVVPKAEAAKGTPAAETGAAAAATPEAAAEFAVQRLAAGGGPEFFGGRPVIFVAQVRDATSDRLNTPAVRLALERALTRGERCRSASREAERKAKLDEVDVLAGVFARPSLSESLARFRQAGVRYAFFATLTPTAEADRPELRLWTLDVDKATMSPQPVVAPMRLKK